MTTFETTIYVHNLKDLILANKAVEIPSELNVHKMGIIPLGRPPKSKGVNIKYKMSDLDLAPKTRRRTHVFYASAVSLFARFLQTRFAQTVLKI